MVKNLSLRKLSEQGRCCICDTRILPNTDEVVCLQSCIDGVYTQFFIHKECVQGMVDHIDLPPNGEYDATA